MKRKIDAMWVRYGTGPEGKTCGDCPYSDGPDGCVGYLMRDALEVLKGSAKNDAE